MTRSLTSIVALFALMMTAVPAMADLKVGYVDLQRALNEVDEGAAAKAKLKKEFDGKQKTLDAKQESLKAKKEEIDARGIMMKPEVKQEKMAELQKELLEVQQLYYQMQQELSAKEQEATAGIFQKMGVILEQMGRDQGYTMIVDRSAVLYAKSSMDLTNELIRRYDQSYGVKGGKKKKKGK